jgi:hypothetical protein
MLIAVRPTITTITTAEAIISRGIEKKVIICRDSIDF